MAVSLGAREARVKQGARVWGSALKVLGLWGLWWVYVKGICARTGQ